MTSGPQYGNLDPVEGGDAVVEWIGGATSTIVWQHHLLSVYHVDVDGDTASALSYLTSYQEFTHEPDVAKTLVARYHDELRRTPGRLEAHPARGRVPVGRVALRGRRVDVGPRRPQERLAQPRDLTQEGESCPCCPGSTRTST